MTSEEVLSIYRSTVDDVYRYASRLTGGDRARTEELVQDTYLAFIRHHRERPGVELTPGWLIVTCRNRFLDQLRGDRRRARRERAASQVDDRVDTSPDPLDLLAGLPSHQRAALLLRYVDGFAVPDIARALGRSIHATESLLARGRATARRLHALEEES
jgi:RNA polymerase sigma-70 factor, ECF subfamily